MDERSSFPVEARDCDTHPVPDSLPEYRVVGWVEVRSEDASPSLPRVGPSPRALCELGVEGSGQRWGRRERTSRRPYLTRAADKCTCDARGRDARAGRTRGSARRFQERTIKPMSGLVRRTDTTPVRGGYLCGCKVRPTTVCRVSWTDRTFLGRFSSDPNHIYPTSSESLIRARHDPHAPPREAPPAICPSACAALTNHDPKMRIGYGTP